MYYTSCTTLPMEWMIWWEWLIWWKWRTWWEWMESWQRIMASQMLYFCGILVALFQLIQAEECWVINSFSLWWTRCCNVFDQSMNHHLLLSIHGIYQYVLWLLFVFLSAHPSRTLLAHKQTMKLDDIHTWSTSNILCVVFLLMALWIILLLFAVHRWVRTPNSRESEILNTLDCGAVKIKVRVTPMIDSEDTTPITMRIT